MLLATPPLTAKPAPKLVSAAQVASMKPGSVIVDLAVEQGGNVEGSKVGEVADVGGVKLVGYANLPGRIAADASNLYARNLVSFAGLLVNKEGALAPDYDDEILKASLLTRDGKVVHPSLA
jgi:NAD(P) transhydrogenase subunit alpha